MKLKIAVLLFVILTTEFIAGLLAQTADPSIRTSLSVDAVNGSSTALRSYEYARGYTRAGIIIFYAAVAAFLFVPRKK